MPLAEAIDGIISYVHRHPDEMTGDDVEDFGRLTREPHLLVLEMGRTDLLPKRAEMLTELEMEGLPRPSFISNFNLPGDWVVASPDDAPLKTWYRLSEEPPVPPAKNFRISRIDGWFAAMDALRTLVARLEAKEPSAKEGPASETEQFPDGALVDEDLVPVEFRDGRKPGGPVLTAPYLGKTNPEWCLPKQLLTSNYGPGKKLTKRIEVRSKTPSRGKRPFAYLYTEVAALRRDRTDKMD